jgi:hypothetical protein
MEEPFGAERRRCEDNITYGDNFKEAEKCGMRLQDTRYGTVAGSCEKGNGLSGSIKVVDLGLFYNVIDYFVDLQCSDCGLILYDIV